MCFDFRDINTRIAKANLASLDKGYIYNVRKFQM